MRVGMVVNLALGRILAAGFAMAAAYLFAGAAAAQTAAMRSPGTPAPGRPMMSPGIPSGPFGPPTITLRDALFGQQLRESRGRIAPPVARYLSQTGEIFILDRTGQRPLLKFEGSGEVWALESQAAPRGDVIYKNDVGEPVLRATRLGGLTVFTPDQPDGAAAALMGNGAPIRMQAIGPEELFAVLAAASARASRAAKRLIPIEAKANDENAPLVADAAGRAADAVVRMSRTRKSRAFVDKIAKIVIGEGRKPEATMNAEGVVHILVTPELGLAGRPSSDRVAYAAGDR
jgi:hypothetical protein